MVFGLCRRVSKLLESKVEVEVEDNFSEGLRRKREKTRICRILGAGE